MSSADRYSIPSKRKRRFVYSPDSEDSFQTKLRLEIEVLNEDEEVISSISMSSRSTSPVDESNDAQNDFEVSNEDEYRIPSISLSSRPIDGYHDDTRSVPLEVSGEEYRIPSISISFRSMSPTDISRDDSDEEYKLSANDEPLSDILQAADIPYSDVDFSDFESDSHDDISVDSDYDEEIAVDDAYIDHDSADLEITPGELHDIVFDIDFDFAIAKKLIHTKYSFDWETESLPFEIDDLWQTEQFFDYTCVEDSPLQAMSASKSRLDSSLLIRSMVRTI